MASPIQDAAPIRSTRLPARPELIPDCCSQPSRIIPVRNRTILKNPVRTLATSFPKLEGELEATQTNAKLAQNDADNQARRANANFTALIAARKETETLRNDVDTLEAANEQLGGDINCLLDKMKRDHINNELARQMRDIYAAPLYSMWECFSELADSAAHLQSDNAKAGELLESIISATEKYWSEPTLRNKDTDRFDYQAECDKAQDVLLAIVNKIKAAR